MRKLVFLAVLPLGLAGAASACTAPVEASRGPVVLADNSPTSTPTPAAGDASKKVDTTAYPNSPNGSPAAGDKGAPVVTDRAACAGTGAAAACADSPKPSSAADTSDTLKATPTTVNGSAPKQ